ncbi:hypothetical protein ACIBG8_04060 [Nonomuraea sp. NPDC050556]|uniref:hypothetical protein n=1 Tax=Nonomuraea sp. NPDC050556 TaxID=3364369 RepID=UPI0037B5DE9C
MRKIIATALLAATAFGGTVLATTTAAQASTTVLASDVVQPAGQSYSGTVATNGAPIKAAPAKASDTIDWLPYGTQVTGTVQGSWLALNGGGYVYLGRLAAN